MQYVKGKKYFSVPQIKGYSMYVNDSIFKPKVDTSTPSEKRDKTNFDRRRFKGQDDVYAKDVGDKFIKLHGKTYLVIGTKAGTKDAQLRQGPRRKTISKASVSVTPAQERYSEQQRRNKQNTGRNEADGLGRFLGKVSSTIRGTDNSKPAPTPTSNGNKTLASINKANTIRKQKLVAAANARRRAQQEATKEKEKSSAGTTQVVATSGSAAVAPKGPRTSGGRTTSGRTVPRRRKYLDSTPAVPRTRRQRAVAPVRPVAPEINREELIYPQASIEVAPRVAQVDIPNIASANNLWEAEGDFTGLRKLRQQYKRGGKVRC